MKKETNGPIIEFKRGKSMFMYMDLTKSEWKRYSMRARFFLRLFSLTDLVHIKIRDDVSE